MTPAPRQPDIAVRCESLCKAYKLYDRVADRLKEIVHPFGKRYCRDLLALREVSFELRKGECLGIIGNNGSGKSTLLKMISGVLAPTRGRIEVEGRVAALLELGVGFNPDMTGLENLYFNGALAGRDEAEMDRHLPAIEAFADIGDLIRRPVRTYSTGMFLRLAFAAAISADPDLLIIDEGFAVGDARFQQKCFRKIRELSRAGKTILLVSHNMGAVVNLCGRAIWLQDGAIFRAGNPEQVAREYLAYSNYSLPTRASRDEGRPSSASYPKEPAEPDWDDLSGCASFGEGGVEIRKAVLRLRGSPRRCAALRGGEQVIFALEIAVKADIRFPIVGFVMKDSLGNSVLGINTSVHGTGTRPLLAGETVVVEFGFEFPRLKNAHYTFSPAVAEGTQESHVQHHWVHDACVVQVLNDDARHKLGCALIVESADISVRAAGPAANPC